MRQTNFNMGYLPAGYQSSYNNSFANYKNDGVHKISKGMINEIEKSHWDHSRSWSVNFNTETGYRFKYRADKNNYSRNKIFGVQNTLNQIGTHYQFGDSPRNFETTTQSQLRDTSATRRMVFETKKVKDF